VSSRGCEVGGCSDRHYAKGKCQYHYSQMSNKTTRVRARYVVPSRSAICSAEGCSERPSYWRQVEQVWFCRFHYQRAKKGVAFDAPIRFSNAGKCAVESCARKAKSRSLCSTHYARSVKGLDLDAPIKIKKYLGAICKIEGCKRIAKWDFMCRAHAERVRSGLPVNDKPFKRVYLGEVCERSGCSAKASSLGLCRYHYSIVRKYGQNALELVANYFLKGCPLCHRTAEEAGQPYVDHDHSCCAGQNTCGECVRGAICTRCNSGLGMFQDSLEIMKRAMRYLQGNHPAALLKEVS